jgi:hypothetical protein
MIHRSSAIDFCGSGGLPRHTTAPVAASEAERDEQHFALGDPVLAAHRDPDAVA